MALGGGTFLVQNKKLPGTYINFVSAKSADAALSDRGIAAVGITTGWGRSGEVFEVTSGDFQKNSLEIFGCDYTADELKGLRDLFLNAVKAYVYRLDGSGVKAANSYATAKYAGTKGNSIKTVIRINVDDSSKFDVITVFGTAEVDTQTVLAASELVSNKFVDFKTDAELAATAGTALTGGTDSEVNGAAHQAMLDALEAYSFNALACTSTENTIKALYAAYCKRMRDEVGQKLQVVVQGYDGDYEGVININPANTVENGSGCELVYWVTGVAAGTAVNASATNMRYNGEYAVNCTFSQTQLETAIDNGLFTFHKVGQDVRVLTDINSLVTVSDTKGKAFKKNQTIRVIDQIANDTAVLFANQYLGVVPNDAVGRGFLRDDISAIHEQLDAIRAIEDFKTSDITVEQGDEKASVVVTSAISVVNAMEKLYMTVTVG